MHDVTGMSIASLQEAMARGETSAEEIAKALNVLKEALTDRSDSRPPGKEKDTDFTNSELSRIGEIISEVTQEIIERDTVPLILAHLDVIEFEVCGITCHFFSRVVSK